MEEVSSADIWAVIKRPVDERLYFGLRGTTEPEHEASHGFEGDLLNLSWECEGFLNHHFPNLELNGENWAFPAQLTACEIQDPDVSKVVTAWSNGVKHFIGEFLKCNPDLRFTLVELPDRPSPWDLEEYGQGLGKVGKRRHKIREGTVHILEPKPSGEDKVGMVFQQLIEKLTYALDHRPTYHFEWTTDTPEVKHLTRNNSFPPIRRLSNRSPDFRRYAPLDRPLRYLWNSGTVGRALAESQWSLTAFLAFATSLILYLT